jgi:hypothetical protein
MEFHSYPFGGRKVSIAMRTSVTLGYLLHGVPIKPNREICILNIHPDVFDGISLDDLISVATATYDTVEGDFGQALEAILPVLKDLYSGKKPIGSATDHLTYLQHGRFLVNGQYVHPDEIRVVFRAFTARRSGTTAR